MISSYFKNYLILSITIASMSLCCSSPGYAEDPLNPNPTYIDTLVDADADAIAANDAATKAAKDESASAMDKVAKNTFAVLKALNSFILSWLHPDDSKSTTDIAPNFFNYFKYKFENDQLQLSSQASLLQGFIPASSSGLTYMALLGNIKTDSPEQQASALSYIKNTSSINITHATPTVDPNNLVPGQNAIPGKLYRDLYNTTAAIQTYNAYLLSKYYAEYKNGAKLTKVQYDLQQKASDQSWLLSIATEASIGIILRQILLFTSQLYLLQLESLDVQNKQLAATAMTNSLLVLANQNWEVQLHDYAAGRKWPYN